MRSHQRWMRVTWKIALSLPRIIPGLSCKEEPGACGHQANEESITVDGEGNLRDGVNESENDPRTCKISPSSTTPHRSASKRYLKIYNSHEESQLLKTFSIALVAELRKKLESGKSSNLRSERARASRTRVQKQLGYQKTRYGHLRSMSDEVLKCSKSPSFYIFLSSCISPSSSFTVRSWILFLLRERVILGIFLSYYSSKSFSWCWRSVFV